MHMQFGGPTFTTRASSFMPQNGLVYLAHGCACAQHSHWLVTSMQVRLALHHLSKRRVAVKVIDKSKLTDVNETKRIQREIRVMLHLTHECVIKLFEVSSSGWLARLCSNKTWLAGSCVVKNSFSLLCSHHCHLICSPIASSLIPITLSIKSFELNIRYIGHGPQSICPLVSLRHRLLTHLTRCTS